MDILESLILGLAGLFGGVLAGLFGVGGGTVFVPALVYGAGWSISEAVAASLVVIVFSALSGTLRSMRSEVPRRLEGGNAPVADRCAVFPDRGRGEPLLLGYAHATGVRRLPPRARLSHGAVGQAVPRRPNRLLGLPPRRSAARGIAAGALAGLIGIGGAVLTVPLLIFGFG